MTGEGDGFLSRWSRRKSRSRELPEVEDREAPPGALPAAAEAGEGEEAGAATARDPDRLTEEQVAALPDPDSLGLGDDFKPFMRPGVPQALRRRALRRLWSVNPFFNVRDGLDDYDEDYTDAATVVPNLRTLFEPGKGMPQPERWRKPEAPAQVPAETPADLAAAESPGGDESPADPPDEAPDVSPDEADVEGWHGADTPPALEQREEIPSPATAERSGPGRQGAARRRWGGFAVAPAPGSDAADDHESVTLLRNRTEGE